MPYTTSNGTRIYWEESGGGDPLLLIMGLGYALEMWHRSRPLLSQHYRTIAFDNRGVGKSDVPAGPYTNAQMADDAAAVLDAAGVDRAHVFGISMGGMIAQEFAIAHPTRVRSLILGCTACGGSNAVRAEPEVLQIVLARATMTPEEGAQAIVPFIYDRNTPRERIEEDLAIRRRVYPTEAGYMGQVQAIFAWESFDRLPEIQAPTLILHGQSDELVPPENARILQKQIRGSRLVMLPHASHIFSTDQPEAAHREILGFLSAAPTA
ncbi:MAG TPA: alpha/beta fold hydrolase [Bryobacteraceae bacterium]|nr:alpha/beta fold hydrolase [Bryobacteraceae bacterium]